MIQPRLLLLLLPLLAPACAEEPVASSTDLRKAQALLAAKKYDEAYAEYERIAKETGNPLAQFSLGLFHRLGWGRPEDPAAACAWFEKAAEGKIPAAEHYFAEFLIEGVQRPADPARAIILLESAASGGHYLSYYSIAEMYFDGNGVPKDPAKGLELCLRAAGHGVVKAQLHAGWTFFDGKLVAQDLTTAYSWFEKAAIANDPRGQCHVGLMSRAGLGRPRDLEVALSWYERAASQGHASAYFPLGALYFGDGKAKPPAKRLAKAYLWLSASTRRSEAVEKKQAAELLERVIAIMPKTWRSDLDAKVEEHLARYAG